MASASISHPSRQRLELFGGTFCFALSRGHGNQSVLHVVEVESWTSKECRPRQWIGRASHSRPSRFHAMICVTCVCCFPTSRNRLPQRIKETDFLSSSSVSQRCHDVSYSWVSTLHHSHYHSSNHPSICIEYHRNPISLYRHLG